MYKKAKNLDLKIKIESAKTWFSSPLDSKIYIILSAISLTLLFYSIWEIKPVSVDITDFIGLTSHLTLAYWLGYILIIFCLIRLYFDTDNKNELIHILILIIVGLFLFGVPIFAEENARFPWSYYPAGEVKTILETKYIDSISPYPLISYRSWPATHLISATILYLTGIKIENLLKYMPVFWLFSVVFIIFSIGKRLKFSVNQSFLASFIILSSFWTFHYYYGPPSFAYILYLLLFMFIVSFSNINKIRDTILISLTFAVLVITHMLTSMALISSFMFSSKYIKSIYEKRTRFMIFFLIVFIAWYVYLAPVMFRTGVEEFIKQATGLAFFSFFQTEKYSAGELLTREITHYSRLFYLGIYAISMIYAAALYLTGRIKEEKKELTKICFFWFIGVLVLFVFKYGAAEIDDRIYIYSLVPMACILTLTLNRKTLVILSILLVIPHIPAHYGSESYEMITSTELVGSKFFAMKITIENNESYFSMFDTFVNYYDSETINYKRKSLSVAAKPNISMLYTSDYIINSKSSHNLVLYAYGVDPIQEGIRLCQNNVSLLYNNGYYQIYINSIS